MKEALKLLAGYYYTIFVVVVTILLTSCNKEVIDVELPHNNKALTKSGKVVLGSDNTTKKPIVARFNIKIAAAGKHDIEFEHVNYIAESQFGHYVEFNATINEHSELIILGDIISIGFEEGECDWCDCMTGIGEAVQNADSTGGWATTVFATLCPECVLLAAAAAASYCAGSAISPF